MQSIDSISNDYVLSVCNDRNSLLICLNQLLTSETPMANELVDTLFGIHCNHLDSYVKHITSKVLIKVCVKQNHDLSARKHCWHCLPQMCQFLNLLSANTSIDSCLGLETIIDEICDKLCEMCGPVEAHYDLCKDHCLCFTPEAVKHLTHLIEDNKLNTILLNLLKVLTSGPKRCFVTKCLNLLICVVKQKGGNRLIMQTISQSIFGDHFLCQSIDICNTLYTFGGSYSGNGKELVNDYGCDVVMIRQLILLSLLTLSCETNLEIHSDDVSRSRLQMISQYVRKKWSKFDENDWIIRVFIEEDEQLLNALYCVMSLGDNQMSHLLMNAFIGSIGGDSGVLLDMLCSDEQTATLLLKLLLIYLKLSDINISIEMNVKNVLLELRDKMQRLTAKQLFPYNVKPLIKLMNKLKT